MQTENYFTLAYADVDLISGAVAMVQAGHPHPAILRADGRTEYLGQGGLPIGLLESASYDTIEARLAPGDRLLPDVRRHHRGRGRRRPPAWRGGSDKAS